MDAADLNSIICPRCGADLPPTVAICSHCGGSTLADRSQPKSNQHLTQLLDRPWVLVVLLLHVGLLGIPIYWRTKYSLPTRLLLVVGSIAYTVTVVALVILILRWIGRALLA